MPTIWDIARFNRNPNLPPIQTLKLAQIPQLLQIQLTETNLHQTLQLLCIDGSKFDNPDNPATDIYPQVRFV